MAGIIGLRGPDIEKRDALRGFRVEFRDADRPIIRPMTGAPVLHLEDGKPAVSRHVFGFTPRFSSFNARDDRLASSSLWKGLYGKTGRHGVAPVSYILEWGDIGDGRGKRPWRIERADGAAMCVPALVGECLEQPGARAFALVTVEPNAFFRSFHDRMVAQLEDAQLDVWLHPEDHPSEEVQACLRRPPDEELVAYPLAPRVGSARSEDAGALEAVGPPVRQADLERLRSSPPPRGLDRFL
ncbi:MAG TPA: SOS response-associated peptidase family protein [Candidatus Thermoplasmatota archaeon]|nr:SOS response-associated peptidase family protein [Candidatus Thermoplasmatota archaeon]